MACPSSGAVKLTTDNAILQNVDIGDCGIDIDANNVTVRNVRAHSGWKDGFLAIVRVGGSATFDRVEFFGNGLTTTSVQYAVFAPEAAWVVIDKADFHHCADCVQGEHVTLTNSWIHDMANIVGTSHVDDFQCNASCSGTVIRHNRIINDADTNMGVAFYCDFGTPDGVVLDDNLIDSQGGGSFAIFACGRNHRITNNHVGRGSGGWLGIPSGSGAGNFYSGNVDLSGAPLNP
jgi:hypothetical protein